MDNEINFYDAINTLVIRGNYYNEVWFKYFGEIQHKMLEYQKRKICVDLEECMFISPTPFLSLLLTLCRLKEENGCTIEISLGNNITEEKKKFLNYCAREGFLEIINNISENKCNISEYKGYNVIGNDNFENVLSARIIDITSQRYSVEELVNSLVNEINESNLNVNKNQRLYMVVALRNILQELIDNVDKHAYDMGNKYFAMYIRIRYATDSTMRTGIENNMYSKTGQTTKPDEIYIHKAIEVYFQDIGKGIVKSHEEKGLKYENRPLREIVNYVFFREEYENRSNNTSINGLAFLRKILQEKNNYFTVYNQFEGTGAFGIADKKMNVNHIHMKDYNKDTKYEIMGQIYNFTLFDREYKKEVKKEAYEGLLEIYRQKYKVIDNYVIDFRKMEKFLSTESSIAILFMPTYITKNVIFNKLRLVFQGAAKLKTLIIADVKDEELVLFDLALEGLYINNFKENVLTDVLEIEQIFIVTESLEIRNFHVEKNRLKRKAMSFREFNQNYEYLYRIKVYESEELARVLKTNTIGKYILTKGNIEWTGEQKFKGFINFDMLAANDICFDLLQRNLERIIPIIGNKKLYAIDSAVERLVSSVNCFREINEKEHFGVGSVFVSGMTLQSSDYQGNTVHFFNRGKGERKPALFFDPVYLYAQKEKDDGSITYVRIGKSSRIKRKNHKEPIRNTNSFLEEKEMYKILHQYAYSSVLCGHLNFENRHDLLNINLNAIMYDESTRLKEYVEGIINYSLGHYFEKDLEESKYFEALRNTCLILYPYNQFTSSILKQCNIDEKYSKYIFGLTPTNITSTGEDLEYSECFTEYIAEIIEKFKQNNQGEKLKIVIFDTLSYSGRTRQEIYEYVNSIEGVAPCFVSIIDARVNHYPKQNNTFNYMNVNVPLLGKSETCKICLVLSKLEAFKDNIIDATILSAIEKLQVTWEVQDVRNNTELIKLSNFDRIYAENIVTYNSDICSQQDELYFVNALPLYIFITNRIKLENDFYSMEFVLDNYIECIGKDSMAYILSLFLLEYGDSIYHSLQQKICIYLLDYMEESMELEIRQLSVIAILSLKEEHMLKIILKYIANNEASMKSNPEGQIVLMYFLNKEKDFEPNGQIVYLYNKMKSGNNRLDLYKQFHCQLKNTNGNVHNSPLKRLIDEQENIENTRLAMTSLSLLEQSLNCTELTFDMLYEEGRDNSENKRIVSEVKEKCLHCISEIKATINQEKNAKINREKLNKIFMYGQELHKSLFAPHIIQSKSENRNLVPIGVLLAEIVEKFNEKMINDEKRKEEYYPIFFDYSYNSKINVSSNISAIYYIWNNMLVQEINYLLDNVVKFVSEEETVITEDGEKSSGEVTVKITPMYFIISIYNNTKEDVNEIKRKLKQRYQKEVLGLLGVKFDCCENGYENKLFNKDAIITRIIIPNIQNVREV